MKKLTRKTLAKIRDDLGFIERRTNGETLDGDDYQMALETAEGNRVIASLFLGISEGTLRMTIERNRPLAAWLAEAFPVPGMILAPEPIDPDLVKAELDRGNDSIASIARVLCHGRTTVKNFFKRNPEMADQLASLNVEI